MNELHFLHLGEMVLRRNPYKGWDDNEKFSIFKGDLVLFTGIFDEFLDGYRYEVITQHGIGWIPAFALGNCLTRL